MKNNMIVWLIYVIVVVVVASCTDMNDYLKYTNGKELVYSGRVDSAFVHSGKNRVLIKGLVMSDPKVVKVRAYWNSRSEMAEINLERSAAVDTIKIYINLPEGRYNFELFTYDKDGNSSVAVPISGSSYGARYEGALSNQPIKSIIRREGKTIITLYKTDETVEFTEITFTDSGSRNQVLRVKNDATIVELANIPSKSLFKYQTFYKPNKKALDIFSAKAEMLASP